MPSRRHCRQTGPIYLAKLVSPNPSSTQVRFTAMAGLRPAYLYLNGDEPPPCCHYTLRFFGGRHPLCGIGVESLIPRTSSPDAASARIADSRPDPGPLTRTSTVRSPTSFALDAAVIDACCAANGVPLRDPRNPSDP